MQNAFRVHAKDDYMVVTRCEAGQGSALQHEVIIQSKSYAKMAISLY